MLPTPCSIWWPRDITTLEIADIEDALPFDISPFATLRASRGLCLEVAPLERRHHLDRTMSESYGYDELFASPEGPSCGAIECLRRARFQHRPSPILALIPRATSRSSRMRGVAHWHPEPSLTKGSSLHPYQPPCKDPLPLLHGACIRMVAGAAAERTGDDRWAF